MRYHRVCLKVSYNETIKNEDQFRSPEIENIRTFYTANQLMKSHQLQIIN